MKNKIQDYTYNHKCYPQTTIHSGLFFSSFGKTLRCSQHFILNSPYDLISLTQIKAGEAIPLIQDQKTQNKTKIQPTFITHYNQTLSFNKFLGLVHIFGQEFTNHASFGQEGNILTAIMPI